MKCWFCGREIVVDGRVGFREECAGCGRPTHVCRNCEFYDPAYNNACREPMAERVVDKERANFCEYFARASTGKTPRVSRPGHDAKSRLEGLFKKK